MVRRRTDDDMDDLLRLAAVAQQVDGYPPHTAADLRAFLAAPDALAAWVADLDGVVAGHVALHRESMPVVMARAAQALGRDPSTLAVVARLVVAPDMRRAGAGRALLNAAAADARRRGLHPILDVLTRYAPAAALYRSCGWRNVGEVTMVFADGGSLQSYVYVAPDG